MPASKPISAAIPYGNPAQLDALAAAVRGESVDRDGRPEPRATICPYRGLFAFREEDATFFFGRETYTAQLGFASLSM